MKLVTGRRMLGAAATMALAIGASGCSQVRGRQGYIIDPTLTAAIQSGVDNRESVIKSLGRPTFVGQFDANDWYYVSRETRALAFANPRPVQQEVFRIRFDAAGNVANVEKTGLDKVASINPENKKTPTLGRDRSFFQELFGNIGRVGAGGIGGGGAQGTTPNGG